MTSAVRSSIVRSYSSSGIVRPSGLRSHRISAPAFRAHAIQTWPSVGKSSSDRITVRRSPDRSRHDAIVESAIEMFVVSATSSGSQPASAENERLSAAIRGKMSSNQTRSGAPLEPHASR